MSLYIVLPLPEPPHTTPLPGDVNLLMDTLQASPVTADHTNTDLDMNLTQFHVTLQHQHQSIITLAQFHVTLQHQHQSIIILTQFHVSLLQETWWQSWTSHGENNPSRDSLPSLYAIYTVTLTSHTYCHFTLCNIYYIQ